MRVAVHDKGVPAELHVIADCDVVRADYAGGAGDGEIIAYGECTGWFDMYYRAATDVEIAVYNPFTTFSTQIMVCVP